MRWELLQRFETAINRVQAAKIRYRLFKDAAGWQALDDAMRDLEIAHGECLLVA